jgi:MFS transporter, ACS family, tartrate transporter
MMARIMITWGFCSALTAFVETPFQFYLVRFALGIAEAGFFPGIIVYLTHWFPSSERARALAGLIMAIPFSMTLGAPISAKLLELDWLGVSGWRWMFILEGLPSVILGIVVYKILTDHPRDAKWLTPTERDWAEKRLREDGQKSAVSREHSLWQGLRHPNGLKLALALFFSNVGATTIIFWLPTLIKKVSDEAGVVSLVWSTLPFAVGMVALRLLGWASDRNGERKWHCILTQLATAGFLMLSSAPGNSFGWSMFCLCMTAAGVFAWPAPFWVLPTLTLTKSAAAGSIGLINSFGSLAGFVGPIFIGYLLSHNFSMHQSFIFLSTTYAFSAALILSVTIKRPQALPHAGLAVESP